jgi:hypothetical protein
MGGSLRRRNSKEGRQAARRKAAPAGAKGWLRVSTCQIASVSFLERSVAGRVLDQLAGTVDQTHIETTAT